MHKIFEYRQNIYEVRFLSILVGCIARFFERSRRFLSWLTPYPNNKPLSSTFHSSPLPSYHPCTPRHTLQDGSVRMKIPGKAIA